MVSIAATPDGQSVAQHNDNYSKEKLLEGYNLLKIEEITIGKTIRNKDVVFAFMANALGMFNISFFSSFLAIRFHR